MHEVAETAAEWRTRHARTPQRANKSEGSPQMLTHTHTHTQTHELKGSELYPLSERMRINSAGLAWLAWLAWLACCIALLACLAWPGLAWQGGVEEGGSREEVYGRGRREDIQ